MRRAHPAIAFALEYFPSLQRRPFHDYMRFVSANYRTKLSQAGARPHARIAARAAIRPVLMKLHPDMVQTVEGRQNRENSVGYNEITRRRGCVS